MTGVILSFASSTCLSLLVVVFVSVCIVLIVRKRKREKVEKQQRDKQLAIQRLLQIKKKAAQTASTKSRAPPPSQTAPYKPPSQEVPAKPTPEQQAQAGMALFEFDNAGPAPAFEQFDNITFVGRTLETVPQDATCTNRCHKNKYCSHVEVSGGKCILKNRQMAMFDGDAQMSNFLGFEPLPECLGKKCMDGFKSGVQTHMHPNRMDYKPKGGESDQLKGYRELAKMHGKMKDALSCDALCKFAKAMNIIGSIFMFAGPVGGAVAAGARAAGYVSGSVASRASVAFAAVDIGSSAVDLAAAIPNAKNQARTQQALQDTMQALVENPTFSYHNIRGGDLKRMQDGIDCVQYCKYPQASGLPGGWWFAAQNASLTDWERMVKEGMKHKGMCCNSSALSADELKNCGQNTVGELVLGDDRMCTAGENMINSLSWSKLPEAPNNFSDVMFKFYKTKKLDFE